MTPSFNLVVGLIIIQSVVAMLALAWALYSGQMSNLEKKGRGVFFRDMDDDSGDGGGVPE